MDCLSGAAKWKMRRTCRDVAEMNFICGVLQRTQQDMRHEIEGAGAAVPLEAIREAYMRGVSNALRQMENTLSICDFKDEHKNGLTPLPCL
jgi:hypothetical protein